jgi:hypothetical protein
LPSSSSSPPTDELDRLFRRLVLNLAELDPSRLHGPVEIGELYQRLVPYRTHRAELAIDTHEDYEMTVLRLLAGERGYALVEPVEVQEAMAAELAGVNPDTSLFHKFESAKVAFDPAHVRAALGKAAEPRAEPAGDAEYESEPEPVPGAPFEDEPMGGGADDAPEAETAAEDSERLPFALEEESDLQSVAPRVSSAPCAFCGGQLPVGRAVIFCPHCGQNVGIVHCPACGTELDVGWGYCITCGRQMMGLA